MIRCSKWTKPVVLMLVRINFVRVPDTLCCFDTGSWTTRTSTHIANYDKPTVTYFRVSDCPLDVIWTEVYIAEGLRCEE